MVRQANNQTLSNIYCKLNARMHTVRFRSPERIQERLLKTNSEHEKILGALRDRDARRTKEAIRKYVLQLKKQFSKKRSFNHRRVKGEDSCFN